MTHPRGAAHPMAKLGDDDVAAIRRSKLTVTELAIEFNVSKATISLIRRDKSWMNGGVKLVDTHLAHPTDFPDSQKPEEKIESIKQEQIPLNNIHQSDIDADIDVYACPSDVYVWVKIDEEIERNIHQSDILTDIDTIGNVRNVRNLKNSLNSGKKVIRFSGLFPRNNDATDEDETDDE